MTSNSNGAGEQAQLQVKNGFKILLLNYTTGVYKTIGLTPT
jgi:hypothetical protein